MRSAIEPDTRAKCIGCANTSFIQEYFNLIEAKKEHGLKVPKCKVCRNYPNRFRIRRSLPTGERGKSEAVTIRWDKEHGRLKDIFQTVAMNKIVDHEISSGTFNPEDYRSQKHDNDNTFLNFVEKKYMPAQVIKLKRGEISPSGMTNKQQCLKHLLKYFSYIPMKQIKASEVTTFNDTYEGTLSVRRLALQELRVILQYAYIHEKIDKVPPFPKVKQANFRDGENFLTIEEQRMVVEAIADPMYRRMVEVMAIYALRTCEIRALQWGDLDFHNGIIKIQRHFSRNVLIDMRKANCKPHYLPMTERFREIIQDVPFSINASDFIFKGKEGAAVGEKVLSTAWKKAIHKTGMRAIDLYEGIRHSRVSALLEKGYSEDHVMLLSGHETKEAFKRYGQLKAQAKLKIISDMMA